jgi:hypothetical protein
MIWFWKMIGYSYELVLEDDWVKLWFENVKLLGKRTSLAQVHDWAYK